MPGFMRLMRQIMQEHGVDAEKLYFDVPRLNWWIPINLLDLPASELLAHGAFNIRLV